MIGNVVPQLFRRAGCEPFRSRAMRAGQIRLDGSWSTSSDFGDRAGNGNPQLFHQRGGSLGKM